MTARCPQCGSVLGRVVNTSEWLNDDQFDAIRAGDYFCNTCPGNGRGTSGLCYWWDREVRGGPTQAREEGQS